MERKKIKSLAKSEHFLHMFRSCLRERQTGIRQTDRDRDRKTGTETEIDREIETQTETEEELEAKRPIRRFSSDFCK